MIVGAVEESALANDILTLLAETAASNKPAMPNGNNADTPRTGETVLTER